MKILHVIPSLNKGGAERICLDMCVELQNQGHEVKLVTLCESNRYPFLTQSINHTIISTHLSLSLYKKNKVNIGQLQAIIETFKPDIIHSHLFEAEINLAFCKIPEKTKRVIHFHDNMKQFQKWNWKNVFNKKGITNYYERSLVLNNFPKNSTGIGISKDTTNYIKQNVPETTAQHLPNSVDLKRFRYSPSEIQENYLVMIGSFVPKKGHGLVIKTIAELQNRGKNICLFLLGDGTLKKELESLAKGLGISSSVSFEGLVDNPEDYLKRAKIYLHTALYEPFGLVLVEAMACGLPVVCTDGKGNRDLIEDGENGFMVWERDAKQLADKIQYLLENENERKRMGENAHRFAQQFGMEEYVKKLLLIYSGMK